MDRKLPKVVYPWLDLASDLDPKLDCPKDFIRIRDHLYSWDGLDLAFTVARDWGSVYLLYCFTDEEYDSGGVASYVYTWASLAEVRDLLNLRVTFRACFESKPTYFVDLDWKRNIVAGPFKVFPGTTECLPPEGIYLRAKDE